ncbi:YdeI/OmpD-associated family protein [Mucilaginibacter sp. KACC 22063]|uniref:YdeI/OmpD-associated family protein n=1 Tax=Mucilaginibacter sp. KACC 22063 TaxID=3025666 RepID=UPI002365B915|nr:YdeI/OmpD-associated family protein [Mucilaginibacter sp. KACC 22063]WDF54568.1 YdeI/OmpD-associated family protein [Mucilaginibacter sp. KACC 22063]
MIKFNAVLHQFAEQGEKTGWTYIIIPQDMALELKPGNKKSFRVKGKLDNFAIAGVALMPWGDGSFIMAINADMRKGIRKSKGAMVAVELETHDDYKVEIPEDLQECFDDEPEAFEFFNSLTRGHRDYFIKWINSAKTEPTRVNRIANTVNAMVSRMGYPEMIRALKTKK